MTNIKEKAHKEKAYFDHEFLKSQKNQTTKIKLKDWVDEVKQNCLTNKKLDFWKFADFETKTGKIIYPTDEILYGNGCFNEYGDFDKWLWKGAALDEVQIDEIIATEIPGWTTRIQIREHPEYKFTKAKIKLENLQKTLAETEDLWLIKKIKKQIKVLKKDYKKLNLKNRHKSLKMKY